MIPQSAVQTSSSFVLALSSSFSGPAGAIGPAGGCSGGYSAHAGDGAAHSSTNNNIETWHAGYFTYRASLQACYLICRVYYSVIIVCPYNVIYNGSQFEEDPIIRHIEPPLATHLDLHRLSNFQIKFIPTITRSVHLFAAVPKTVLLRFSLVLFLVFLESTSQRRTLSNCSRALRQTLLASLNRTPPKN